MPCIRKDEQHAGSNCCCGICGRGTIHRDGVDPAGRLKRDPNRSCVDTNTQTSCTHVPSACKPFLRPREQEAGALLTEKKDRPVEFYSLSVFFLVTVGKLNDISYNKSSERCKICRMNHNIALMGFQLRETHLHYNITFSKTA